MQVSKGKCFDLTLILELDDEQPEGVRSLTTIAVRTNLSHHDSIAFLPSGVEDAGAK